MVIESKKLGTLKVDESTIYNFPHGLYGFEALHSYCLVIPDETLPFAYLQSVEEADICLLVANPFEFFTAYEFEISDEDIQQLGNPENKEVAVWVTVSIRDTLDKATANLLAPIVLNTVKRAGRQVILNNNNYETRMALFPRRTEEK